MVQWTSRDVVVIVSRFSGHVLGRDHSGMCG